MGFGREHRESTTRELKGRGRHFFTQIDPNWPLPYSAVPVPLLGDTRPAGWAPFAVYAQVQCREPKTLQEKVQFCCEDDKLFLSSYYFSMVGNLVKNCLHAKFIISWNCENDFKVEAKNICHCHCTIFHICVHVLTQFTNEWKDRFLVILSRTDKFWQRLASIAGIRPFFALTYSCWEC